MINLPLYASTPICAEGVVRRVGEVRGFRVIPPQRAGRGPKRVPIIIKPGAPVADDEDTEAAGRTQDWAEEGAVDAQGKVVRDGRLRWIMIEGGRERAPRTPSVLPNSGDDDFFLCLW